MDCFFGYFCIYFLPGNQTDSINRNPGIYIKNLDDYDSLWGAIPAGIWKVKGVEVLPSAWETTRQ